MDEEMLKVLCQDVTDISIADDSFAPVVSTDEQITFIAKNINHLNYEIKKKICNILVHDGCIEAVSDCNDGVSISINLPDEVIEKMYNLAYFELRRI